MKAEELLQRYAGGERDFCGAELRGVDLSKVDLQGAIFERASLSGANLSHSSLTGTNFEFSDITNANLSMANFSEASLRGASLNRSDLMLANLTNTNLIGAILNGCELMMANLSGANMSITELDNANMNGVLIENAVLRSAMLRGTCIQNWSGQARDRNHCRINKRTYEKSYWTANILADWHQHGAHIEDFADFPIDLRNVILETKEGLCLFLNSQCKPVDRFLVDGIIFGVLGKETDCRMVEFREFEGGSLIRLQATQHADLELVADVLYRRIWENKNGNESQQLIPKDANLMSESALLLLSQMRERIEHIELNLNKKKIWSWDFQNENRLPSRAIRLFMSYAPVDKSFCEALECHLSSLQRQNAIQTWHAAHIQPGESKRDVALQNLANADIIIALISADYLCSSALCEELSIAFERNANYGVRVIPVLVRSVSLAGTPLEHLQILPDNEVPVQRWEDQDAALANIASGIRRVVMALLATPNQSSNQP